MFCPKCGGESLEGQRFCKACGTNLQLINDAIRTGDSPAGKRSVGTRSSERISCGADNVAIAARSWR